MPKMKTIKGVKKRIKLTKNGKIKRRKTGHSHLLSGKSPKRRRALRRPNLIEGKFVRSFQRAMSS